MKFYTEDASWYSFTEHEQYIIAKTARRFARGLREAGFLPAIPKHGEEEDRGV